MKYFFNQHVRPLRQAVVLLAAWFVSFHVGAQSVLALDSQSEACIQQRAAVEQADLMVAFAPAMDTLSTPKGCRDALVGVTDIDALLNICRKVAKACTPELKRTLEFFVQEQNFRLFYKFLGDPPPLDQLPPAHVSQISNLARAMRFGYTASCQLDCCFINNNGGTEVKLLTGDDCWSANGKNSVSPPENPANAKCEELTRAASEKEAQEAARRKECEENCGKTPTPTPRPVNQAADMFGGSDF